MIARHCATCISLSTRRRRDIDLIPSHDMRSAPLTIAAEVDAAPSPGATPTDTGTCRVSSARHDAAIAARQPPAPFNDAALGRLPDDKRVSIRYRVSIVRRVARRSAELAGSFGWRAIMTFDMSRRGAR